MSFQKRLNQIQQQIHVAERTYHRKQNSVQLLAVSKGRSINDIQQAFDAGLSNFGESYFQEAKVKIEALDTLSISWHFIGPLQSNKAKGIAQYFSWVHSVYQPKAATLLNAARPLSLPRLQVLMQINFQEDDKKTGIPPNEALALAKHILTLPRLQLRGLMMIPKPQQDPEKQYLTFFRLSELFNTLNQSLDYSLDTLSMGMSQDYLAAIRAGSTIVRLGRSLFGET